VAALALALAPFVLATSFVLATLVSLAAADRAGARGAPSEGRLLGQARVVEVVDGDTLRLDRPIEGATEVRLVGIQAPKLPLDRPGFEAWPLADVARGALTGLAQGQTVALVATGRALDRHGRLLAHAYRIADDEGRGNADGRTDGSTGAIAANADGLWLQAEMLRLGLARVYTFDDNRGLAREMLAIERAARAEDRGIWADPYYARRDAAALDDETGKDLIGTFQLVEGTVLETARVGRFAYLNFGSDWRTDFTISIPAKALADFGAAGLEPSSLKGARVRVRGWIDKYNGPIIQATHPEQIELLEPAPEG
jgi:endonuclease YncB( thermonuclease family)